jgi:peroxiredoxin
MRSKLLWLTLLAATSTLVSLVASLLGEAAGGDGDSKAVPASAGSQASSPRAALDSPLGRLVDDFTLDDCRGRSYRLSQWSDAPVVVLAFLGTECPLVRLYAPRLEALAAQYGQRGVVIVGINANSHDSVTEIAAFARRHALSFPILKDVGNRLADRLGAQRTPEVFVLDAQRRVRYHGRIDDQYGIGYQRDEPRRRDLEEALLDLLAGRDVRVPQTEPVGCLIGRVRQPDARAEVTYARDIAPILQRHCVECHREGDIAPFALTDYREVAGWAEMIAEVVRQQRMPPWHASAKYGRFANERRLSDEEKRLIEAWAAAGAPQGDASRIPPPPQFVEGWNLPRPPDLVVPMRREPFAVPAEGTVRYQYFVADPGIREDRWIRAVEVVPGNRAVVHHVLVFARPPGGAAAASGAAIAASGARGGIDGYLAGYVPGLRPQPFPPGMAKRLPAGSQLIFQVHYTPIGTPQEDISRVGFVFATPEEVEQLTHEVVTTSAVRRALRIPPHDPAYTVTGESRTASAEVLLLSMMPHMHLRGKAVRYDVLYPDGHTQTVLDVPQYDFNWQTSYRLAEPLPLPAGARIRCTFTYDNSEQNLNNPDPSQTVTWGDQTWDEMAIGYFDVAIPRRPQATGGDAGAASRGMPDAGRLPRADDSPDPLATRPTANTDAPPDASDERPAADALALLRQRAAALLARYDANGDGVVHRDEMPQVLRVAFDRCDLDSDGRIDQDELTRALQKLALQGAWLR